MSVWPYLNDVENSLQQLVVGIVTVGPGPRVAGTNYSGKEEEKKTYLLVARVCLIKKGGVDV